MSKDSLAVAVADDGSLITIPANGATRGVIMGVSGSGKTQGAMVLLAELAQCENISVVIIDPKKVGFFPCVGRFDIITDENLFTPVIEAYYGEMMRRYEWMKDHRTATLPRNADFPLLWLIIDEIAEFLSGDKKTVQARTDVLTRIAALSRQANMSFIIIGQQLDTTVIPSKFRSNMVDTQMLFRTASMQHTRLIVADGFEDEAPAHQIPAKNPGQGYFISPNTDGHYVAGKGLYITDSQLADICREHSNLYCPAVFLDDLEPES